MSTVIHHTVLAVTAHATCGSIAGALLSWVEARQATRDVGFQPSCSGGSQTRRHGVAACVAGAVFTCLGLCVNVPLELVELEALCCVLLFLSLVDARRRVIPNGCIAVGAAIRLCSLVIALVQGSVTLPDACLCTLGAFGTGLVLFASVLIASGLLGQEAMGAGDIKLLTLLAWYVGWQQWLLLVVFSCLLGLATFALMRMLAYLRRARASPTGHHGVTETDATFPFGPAISVAFVITVICGQQMVDWYAAVLAG